MSLSTGSRLGPYEILSLLGAGGMGEVYRARDTRLDRLVAVKVLPESLVEDPEALARFEREAKAVAALSHPNILAIHDFGQHEGVAFAVMELLEGETLGERLAASALPTRKVFEYGVQIAQGLAAAHERGIVHRDLKPQNIFLTRDGLVKILDFGLAKSMEPRSSASDLTGSPTAEGGTLPGAVLGTVGYMSPEQVRGEGVDHRSDLFSFGAILYEMIAGRRAFQRGSHIETLTAILRDEPPELARTGQPSAAGPLEEIVAHCLEKSPDERFQSARDLVFALRVAERESLAVPSGRPDSAASAAVATGTGGEASHASIAVLPFRNMSADRDVEYFSDGMTEEIISALSKIEALRVASRTSAFAFKGKDEDVRKIGAALGVRSVLEGSVRQAGRKIRITAQLISVADGYHLWSEKFDREIEDVFAVQDEIARAIAETLKVRLLPAEATRLASRGTEDVGAYDDYLKGRYHFNRREPPEAIAEFERALAKDPGYTAACTGLADSYCIYGFYGGIDTLEALARARAAATKARELEPESADAHVSLALVDHYFAWDLDREELELRRAIELAPRSAAPYSWLGLMLGLRDRTAEALELTHHAASLEPFSANVQTNVGWNLFGARRFDEALEEFGRALHIDPRAPYPLWASGLTCHLSGRHVEAVEFLERAAEVTGRKQPLYLALLGAAYAGAGRRPEAVALLEELRGRPASRYVPPLHLAFTYVALGETDEALSALDRACRERNGLTWYWVRDSAVFDALRSDYRFPSLLAKIVPA